MIRQLKVQVEVNVTNTESNDGHPKKYLLHMYYNPSIREPTNEEFQRKKHHVMYSLKNPFK